MPYRPTQTAVFLALMFFSGVGSASAADLGTQLAAADLLSGFHSSAILERGELGAVSGFGLGQQSAPSVTDHQDVSVILFDELGQPKGPRISAGSGTASRVTNSVNAGFGR